MAGLEGGGPPQPRRHPEEHTSTRGGGPSVSYLPPPQHQTEGDAPSPRGCSPPQPGLYIQWFSAVLWLRGHGGEVTHQSQGLSWTVAVTWVCRSVLGPTVVPFVFPKGGTQRYKSHAQPETSP